MAEKNIGPRVFLSEEEWADIKANQPPTLNDLLKEQPLPPEIKKPSG